MSRFSGQSVIITGGSSGIGLSLAKLLAKNGADVWIVARDLQKIETALSEIRLFSTENQIVEAISADVSDWKNICNTLNNHITEHGTPDILINSAGVAHPGLFNDLDLEIFHWMMDVNYFGTVNTTKIIVPHMEKKKSGTIINISSIAGYLGVYGYTAYGASKYAVTGFTDALRAELAPHGIKVKIVFPPDTQTPQLDYESKYKPEVTKIVAGSAKALSADTVAQIIVKNIHNNKYVITPGVEGKLFYYLRNFFGVVVYPVMDLLIRNARRSINIH